MIDSNTEKTQALMNCPANIRNICVIGRAGCGKSTLVGSLVQRDGIIPTTVSSEADFIKKDQYEPDCSMAIKSMSVRLANQDDDSDVSHESFGNGYLINLIDTPGHGDFSADVTAALRLTDGALVVVDCIEGVCMRTEAVLRQALAEGVKPIIVINNVDRALLELQPSPEELYQSFARTIASVNAILGDARVHPCTSTVAFRSGLDGWVFTLEQFAIRYAKTFGVDKVTMMNRLWGDHYFDSTTGQWTTQELYKGKPLPRAFNIFVLDPISKLFDAFVKGQKEELLTLAINLGIRPTDEEAALPEKDILRSVMREFLPVDALLHMMIQYLPSPVAAQRYRVDTLYSASDATYAGIRDCDPKAELILYVSKMVPSVDRGRFYAVGRVFAGTIRAGMKVYVQGPRYTPGKKEDIFATTVQGIVLLTGQSVESVDGTIAGNIVGIVGIDQYLLKTGMLTTSEKTPNLRNVRLPVLPVQRSVEVRHAADLPKLVEGLKWLSKFDLSVSTLINESGEHVVVGTGELHLEHCLKELKTHAGVPLSVSDPFVAYRETVGAKSSKIALSKSPNKFNRLFVVAEPLDNKVTRGIEEGEITLKHITTTRPRTLVDDYPVSWNIVDARRTWCFGPDKTGANLLVDQTRRVIYLHEIKDSFISGFQWATKEGPICEEPMHATRFNIVDVTLFSDAIHRGSGQIIPTARRVLHAATLLAEPSLMEPVFSIELRVPEHSLGDTYSVLGRKRGIVLGEEQRVGASLITVKAHLPATELFGLKDDLYEASSGHIVVQSTFDRWQTLPDGSPLDPTTTPGRIVREIRSRKGLQLEVPDYTRYYDNL